jgi:hypothetical protein
VADATFPGELGHIGLSLLRAAPNLVSLLALAGVDANLRAEALRAGPAKDHDWWASTRSSRWTGTLALPECGACAQLV